MGTKARSIIYQHLFARFCIFWLDTMGYNWIQFENKH